MVAHVGSMLDIRCNFIFRFAIHMNNMLFLVLIITLVIVKYLKKTAKQLKINNLRKYIYLLHNYIIYNYKLIIYFFVFWS